MRYVGRCAVLLLAALLLGGCLGSRELKNLSLVAALGLDQSKQSPKMVDVTAQIVKIGQINTGQSGQGGQGGGTSSGGPAFWDLTSTGLSVYDAVRGFTHLTHNKLYIAHTEVILFGRQLAQEGLANDLDYLMREQEVRPNMPVAIADTTALEVLGVPSPVDKLPAENLRILLHQQGLTSQGREVVLLDLVNSLLCETSAQTLPLFRVTDNNGAPTVAVDGMAVLKKGYLVGQLDPMQSRGVQWVTGNVQGGVLNIPLQDSIMSYDILRATTKVKPVLRDGVPHMEVSILVKCVLNGQSGRQDVTFELMPALEKRLENQIAAEVDAALQQAWQLNADVFGFGLTIHRSRLMDWQTTVDHWDAIFPKIAVDLSIRCQILAEGGLVTPVLH